MSNSKHGKCYNKKQQHRNVWLEGTPEKLSQPLKSLMNDTGLTVTISPYVVLFISRSTVYSFCSWISEKQRPSHVLSIRDAPRIVFMTGRDEQKVNIH